MGVTKDWRDSVAAAEEMARSVAAEAATTRVDLGEVDLSLKVTVTVALGVVAVNAPLAGAKVGDVLTLRPAAAWPDGFAPTGYAFVTSAGRIEARIITPVITLALAGTVTLKARVIALRAA